MIIKIDVAKSNCAKKYAYKLTVCHMAKENDDPLWGQLVACRLQERNIMNAIVEKYAKEADPISKTARQAFVESCVPEYFR